jgi:hypothetical protein
MADTIGEIGALLNLRIRQGADWVAEFVATNPDGSPVDLTGATIQAKMRKTPSSGATVNFTVDITAPALGKYRQSLTAIQTAALKAADDPSSPDNQFVWDQELVSAGGTPVIPLFYGVVTVFRQVK